MQSWLLWALLGIFPVNGQPVYLISSPFFEAIDVRITAGMVGTDASSEPTILKIRAPGLNATNYCESRLDVWSFYTHLKHPQQMSKVFV